jgi:hypothetical protein
MLLTGGCTINESGPLTLPLIIINEILDVDMYVCTYIWICVWRNFRVGASPAGGISKWVQPPVSNILYGVKVIPKFCVVKKYFFCSSSA